MTIRISAILSMLLCLMACQEPNPTNAPARPATLIAGEPNRFDFEAYKRDPTILTRDGVTAAMSDRTRLSWGSGHGSQVSYNHADGTVYLWYPGNRRIVRGIWKVEDRSIMRRADVLQYTQTVTFLCYWYGPNTYNPVTGQRGGNWTCLPAGVWFANEVESAAGDIFNLVTSVTTPFDLTRERTTLLDLQQRAFRR